MMDTSSWNVREDQPVAGRSMRSLEHSFHSAIVSFDVTGYVFSLVESMQNIYFVCGPFLYV